MSWRILYPTLGVREPDCTQCRLTQLRKKHNERKKVPSLEFLISRALPAHPRLRTMRIEEASSPVFAGGLDTPTSYHHHPNIPI